MIRNNCKCCGKFYWRWPAEIKRTKRPWFCSKKCLSEYYSSTYNCINCGKKVTKCKSWVERGGKYCSRKCRGLSERDRVEVKCVVCNSIFEVRIARKNTARCCSDKCRHEDHSNRKKLYPKTEKMRALIYAKRQVRNLTDTYIGNYLARKINVSINEVPKELIELKRLNIKRKRIIKKRKTHGYSQ